MKYLSLLVILALVGCTNDVLPTPEPSACDGIMATYDIEIRPIIEATCAYSGCHLGGGNRGDYSSYAGLLNDLESGLFRDRVINQRADPNVGMPPNYAPEGRAQDLTPDEILLVECWLDAGHPEN